MAKNQGKDAEQVIGMIPDQLVEKSSERMRIIQAAYNQIEKDLATPAEDFERAKVEAMLRYHSLTITSRDAIRMGDPNARRQLKERIAAMADGAYILRMNQPSKNIKGEKHGHSMVLIKEGNRLFFYDPNDGVDLLEDDDGSWLFDNLAVINNKLQVPMLGIYKVKINEVFATTGRSKHAGPDSNSSPPVQKTRPQPQSVNPAPTPRRKSKSFFSSIREFFFSIGQAIARFFKWMFRLDS